MSKQINQLMFFQEKLEINIIAFFSGEKIKY